MRNLRVWRIIMLLAAALPGCHLHPTHIGGGVLGRQRTEQGKERFEQRQIDHLAGTAVRVAVM